ncbi:MAG: FxsA family protein [Dehalobacterium sp.]
MPILELYVIFYLGRNIGIINTLIIILLTGFFGIFLIRQQGMSVIRDFKSMLQRGQIPSNELLDGLLVLAGAIFLLTPGLITDSFGLLLLLPWSRNFVHDYIKTRLFGWIIKSRFRKY